MGSVSWEILLMEAVEDRGYAKGHRDGYANGRVAGRRQGITMARRQMAKTLLRENIANGETVARLTDLPLTMIESLLETRVVDRDAED
jgi:flagellar biosynthesis/type III secretory pathway protein FliH